MFVFFFGGFLLVILGMWDLLASLDYLWERHELRLEQQGIAAERTDQWEKATRQRGALFVIAGIVFLSSGFQLEQWTRGIIAKQ